MQTATSPEPTEAPPSRRRRPALLAFYQSAVGKKWVMAVTGIVGLGYVFVHMLGNLKVYLGPEEINEYGEALRELGGHLIPRTHLLWILRFVLIGAVLLHVHAAYTLTLMNRKRRPSGYESPREYVIASYASRTMAYTGTVVLAFIVFHLADLTFGTANPDYFRGDVYSNLVASLSRWPVAIFYIIANLALGLHIYHGTWSLFQSMGINNPRFNPLRRYFAGAFTAVILIGNISIPVMVLANVIE